MTSTPRVSGFTIVKNATLLDFPLEASIRSALPGVDEMIVNVGASDDDTLERVRAIGDERIRIVESRWNSSVGHAMLAVETARAMAACRHPWGLYVQADEVLADNGAVRLRELMARHHPDSAIEGIAVDYLHFYGGFDTVAINRRWYRREVRAVRLAPELGIHSFRDAQGFRVGDAHRRIRAVASDVVMHHYGWARPAWALTAKRAADNEIYHWRGKMDQDRPLLPWFPGIRRFMGQHPEVVRSWIEERRSAQHLISPARFAREHLRLRISNAVERLTGWRPFEYRNYTLVSR
jgi:glycosyltransferase involved in cell wall biosynthesis